MAEMGYCPSGRLFEAAACGTPILTDWFDGLDHFFDCESELLIAESATDVMSAIASPDSELREIAGRAKERTQEGRKERLLQLAVVG